jgi:hypothetical protein
MSVGENATRDDHSPALCASVRWSQGCQILLRGTEINEPKSTVSNQGWETPAGLTYMVGPGTPRVRLTSTSAVSSSASIMEPCVRLAPPVILPRAL